MSYKSVETLLPKSLVEEIQKYVDGQLIYIPKCGQNRQAWGTKSNARKILDQRNQQIHEAYIRGSSIKDLACQFYLSQKSIQRIVYRTRKTI